MEDPRATARVKQLNDAAAYQASLKKPLLQKRGSLWYCFEAGKGAWRVGYGTTPVSAFRHLGALQAIPKKAPRKDLEEIVI